MISLKESDPPTLHCVPVVVYERRGPQKLSFHDNASLKNSERSKIRRRYSSLTLLLRYSSILMIECPPPPPAPPRIGLPPNVLSTKNSYSLSYLLLNNAKFYHNNPAPYWQFECLNKLLSEINFFVEICLTFGQN